MAPKPFSLPRCLAGIGLASACAFGQPAPSDWYPRDAQLHWAFSGFYSGAVNSLGKHVWNDASNGPQRSVFSSFGLAGVQINGTNYNFSSFLISSETYTDQGTHWRFNGNYTRGSDQIKMELGFYKDGSFTMKADIVTATAGTKKAWFRMDYDIDGSGNDIYQFVNSATVPYWDATNFEATRSYPYGGPTTLPSGIERNAWARLADGVDPRNQPFIVLWPTGSTQLAADLTFKSYSNDPRTVPPTANTGTTIQTTHSGAGQPGRYPTVGTDQVAYLGLTLIPSGTNTFTATAGGKFFIRPAGRPLRVNLYSQTGTQLPDPDASYVGGSFRTTMNTLTNNRTQFFNFPNKSHTAASQTCSWHTPHKNCLTSAQLHQIMLDWRSTSGIYTQANRDNFRDYTVDYFTINNHWAGGNATGLFFDAPASWGNNANNIVAEGAVGFWPGYSTNWPPNGPFTGATSAQLAGWNAAHEISHIIGMHHYWAQCFPTGGVPYYLGTNGDCADFIATTERHTLENGNVAGTTFSWSPQFVQWYQQGPEGWIKPGRYRATWTGNRRNFIKPGTAGTTLPSPAWNQD